MKKRVLFLVSLLFAFMIFSFSFVLAEEPTYDKYYMFVTDSLHTGNLMEGGNIDYLCNSDVPIDEDSRPTTGTYKAYISSNGNYPGSAISMNSERPIYNTNNLKIADNLADLEDGTLDNRIWPFQNESFTAVWTGIDNVVGKNCSDWSNSIGEGSYGYVGQEISGEIQFGKWADFQFDSCNHVKHIYCVGPFEGERVYYCGDGNCDNDKGESLLNCENDCGIYSLENKYYMFTTEKSYNGVLGGIEGADEKCNSDSRKPSSGTYKAFISSNLNYSVISEMDSSFPIYSADTSELIANNYFDLIDGEIESPIYPIDGWRRIWTKSSSSLSSACGNWNSSDPSKQSYYGTPYAIPGYYPPVYEGWWMNAPSPCNEEYGLYCIGPFGEIESYCGDGIVNPGEECDAGTNNGKYGCNSYCSLNNISYCGNGVCDSNYETCSSCSTDCGECSSGDNGGSSNDENSGGSTTTWKKYIFSIEETNSNQGVTKEIRVGDEIQFYINNSGEEEMHLINLMNISTNPEDVSSNFITLKIESEIIYVNFEFNETKRFDLTDDEYYDLKIKLNEIKSKSVSLTINTISEKKVEEESIRIGKLIILITTPILLLIIILLWIVKKKRKVKRKRK